MTYVSDLVLSWFLQSVLSKHHYISSGGEAGTMQKKIALARTQARVKSSVGLIELSVIIKFGFLSVRTLDFYKLNFSGPLGRTVWNR